MSRRGIIRRLTGLLTGRSGGVVASTVLILTLLLVFWSLWAKWGPLLTRGSEYQLRADRIRVTAPPEWIQRDIKSVVFRDGSLGELSMLDRKLAVKVARAFELHPWVARVKWVRKAYPGEVEVELEYRQPVAMVEVLTDGERGLLPVDAQGVLLQPRDFSETRADQYLRITIDYKHPLGVVGGKWGDDRVAHAARIANRLVQVDWQAMGLRRIRLHTPLHRPTSAGEPDRQPEYVLLTTDDLKIYWGRPPGIERPHEPSARQKVARLREVFRAKGPFSRSTFAGDLDLRDRDTVKIIRSK